MDKRILLAALLVATPFAAPGLLANEPNPTARIDLTGIDPAAPDAVQRAERRIDRAVRDACRNKVEHLTHRARRAARVCREEMRGLALDELRARQHRQMAVR